MTRVPKKWFDPTILSMVLFAINDGVNSDTGVRPLNVTWSDDSPYFPLPDSMDPSSITSAWVKALDEDLRHVRAVSAKFQQELVQERTKDTPEEFQNNIRRFVPFQRDPNVPVGQLNYLLPIRNPIKSFSNARTMWSADMW